MIVFSDDMNRRLADIQAACDAGLELKAVRVPGHPANGYQSAMPPRLVVDLLKPRRITLDLEMAAKTADQLEANGFQDAAEAIRAVLA